MHEIRSTRDGAAPSADPRRSLLVGVGAFVALVFLVASMPRLVGLDDALWRAVLLARGCGTDRVVERAIGIATATLSVMLGLATVAHVRTVGTRSAWPWLSTWALGLLVSKTLKHAFTRDRPSALPDLTVGYSFPSAHVMNGILAMVAIVVLTRAFRRRGRWRVVAALAVLTLVGGRVMLGRHWGTDVVGGALAAVALASFVPPAVLRRPIAAPLVLATLAAIVLAFDAHLGAGGIRLPSPLLERDDALVDLDVGPETSAVRSGGWRESGIERPFGSYLWLEGTASVVLHVPADAVGVVGPSVLALGARPEKVRSACLSIEVALNDRRLARFVPFVGWREYRLAIPSDALRAGENELRIVATCGDRPGRFGVTYARVASKRLAAQ